MKTAFNSISMYLILHLTAGFFTAIHAQHVVVSGKVTDSLQNPLLRANVLAIPEADDEQVRFAITEDNGTYKLSLSKKSSYKITVSYLGYTSQTISISNPNKDLVKDFTLKINPNQLNEVTLNYTPPVVVKKDTISYNVDAFASGEERKLREVLKKLPGVALDKASNVTVYGKKVTKVLVEDKIFFTGDSKLAVNNIPADAVDKVEILDNYNDVVMLKGLQDSDDMAMNIKLKANKKKFVFGDVEVGSGIKDRYIAHPNLFYYSPKTNINFIGDLNNQGVKSFSFRDYLEFEGGLGKLMDDAGAYLNLFNSDFTQFLNNQDYTYNNNQFGALNIRQTISKATDISGYIITSNSKIQTESKSINEYLNFDKPFIEDRKITNQMVNFFTIGKITLNYKPSFGEDLSYQSFIKLTNNKSYGIINTINPTQNNSIKTITDITGLNLKQHVSYSRKLSKSHTATLETSYNFQNDKPISEWFTNQQILQGLIPLQDDDVYNILQTKKSSSHTTNFIIKEYWVLNNFNHIYTSFGINTAFSNYYTQDVQNLSNGKVNNFNTEKFGNDFKYQFINTFVGLEYKFLIGIAMFKPMLYYHFYTWQNKQMTEKFAHNKALLLPQFTANIEFNKSEKINFKYQLNARFSTLDRLANNFVLSSFNSVYRGDNTLENQLYHSISLSYYKFSLFKNLNFNLNSSFNKRISHFKTVTRLHGIEQFNTSILFEQPEYYWKIGGGISKKIKKIKYNLQSNFSYNDFFQLVNNTTNLNISKSLETTVSAETSFKNHPNIEIGYTKSFNNYNSINTLTRFENDRFFTNLEFAFLKSFIFKTDYSLDVYQNKNNAIINTFNNANASLFYQKEDSSWVFEISATNMFNVRFKQQNTLNSFLISDSRTFVMPRIVMFKVVYKL